MSLAHSLLSAARIRKPANGSIASSAVGIAATATAAATAIALGPAAIGTASAAPTPTTTHAHSHSHHSRRRSNHESERARFNDKADQVIDEARKQRGKPYVYGADGPHSFDCSGLVRYVFAQSLHKNLPHNAAEQYRVSQHISRKQLRIGDLAFVDNGGYVSHVGIYDGHGFWWVAPHSGTRVQRQRMYSAHYVYGRVISWPSKSNGHRGPPGNRGHRHH